MPVCQMQTHVYMYLQIQMHWTKLISIEYNYKYRCKYKYANQQLSITCLPLRHRTHNSDHTARRPQRTRCLLGTRRRSPPGQKTNNSNKSNKGQLCLRFIFRIFFRVVHLVKTQSSITSVLIIARQKDKSHCKSVRQTQKRQ